MKDKSQLGSGIEFPIKNTSDFAYSLFYGSNVRLTYSVLQDSSFSRGRLAGYNTDDVWSEAFTLFLERHIGKKFSDMGLLYKALVSAYVNASDREHTFNGKLFKSAESLSIPVDESDEVAEGAVHSLIAEVGAVLERMNEDRTKVRLDDAKVKESLLKSLKPIFSPINDEDLEDLCSKITAYALGQSGEGHGGRPKNHSYTFSLGGNRDRRANRLRARLAVVKNPNSDRHLGFRSAISEAFRG